MRYAATRSTCSKQLNSEDLDVTPPSWLRWVAHLEIFFRFPCEANRRVPIGAAHPNKPRRGTPAGNIFPTREALQHSITSRGWD